MAIKQRIDRRARLLRLCLNALQNTNFVQRHAKGPATADEQQFLHMIRFVGSVAICLAIGRCKQALALIETNGLNVRSRQLCKLLKIARRW